ncbi:MAG: hypothetical protein WDO69_01685 [Pseudomonadota bacterium]
MQKLTSSEGLLIVVELGAEWPTSEIEASRSAKARRVLAQDETESPAAFALRVAEQLGSSFASGVAMASVVVACSERIDEHAQGARAELARNAASALGRAGGGSLCFVASDRNDARSKPALSTLLSDVTRDWQSVGVEVKLSFGQPTLALTEDAAADAKSRASARTSAPVKDSVRRVA